jgi:membrane protein
VLKNLAAVAMTSLAFTFLLMFMPNTRVRLRPGLCGGLIAALLFVAWMWICVRLQVGAVRAGKIYGSFAIVPIVLAWVLVSWEIVLLGAEVAFSVQNNATYRMEQRASRASIESKIVLAVGIVAAAARNLREGTGAFDVAAYAGRHRIPVRVVNEVVDMLVRTGFLAEVTERAAAYALLKSPDDTRVMDVVDAIVKSGADPRALGLQRLDAQVVKALEQANLGFGDTLSRATIRELSLPA